MRKSKILVFSHCTESTRVRWPKTEVEGLLLLPNAPAGVMGMTDCIERPQLSVCVKELTMLMHT